METGNVLFAFGLTLLAGLSTGIGSVMALLSRKFNPKFLAGSLGFSAGVMIYVSFVEIFAKAKDSLVEAHGLQAGNIYTVVAFFAGIALIAIIDRLIPSFENPHEIKNIEMKNIDPVNDKKLLRMGMFSALAIGIHNFPEGLATFIGALADPTLGVSIAVAIAIHNIPEGIAVSVPIYYATKSRSKAFWLSFLSGLAEPVGALLGFFILMPYFNESTFGIIFAGVAGIMVYISLDELLPTAEEYGEHHVAIGGLIAGMAVMAISLLLFV
ncbi:MAG: zinc transporter ZupT [Bacteroidales bacterium]|jgi:ZIP family zinc transporter|nr:zinc transporter ZupT [Bacteroidales bacterium]NCU35238.1 zinc transporter ZupT [Candidatus Falkowbacteria bacterium]MDD2630833.1 zinc transporter ZupT [Bacteroidales bacterium]MDD3132132.1 zinc transporter ZupT [Bacteroidales bacterium]MDD3526045.1 zinc transporter ZupT [Bacteroidales bacterium]